MESSFLSSYAPFFAQNWQWISLVVGITIILVVLFDRLFKKQPPVPSNTAQTQKKMPKDEHPMAEFSGDTDFGNMSAPALHSPDTPHITYPYTRLDEKDMIERSSQFYKFLNKRRSVRDLSPDNVPREVIENIVRTAGTSPSGAHTEPWTFVIVHDKETKTSVRNIIEQEEYLNYNHRMGDKWVSDLKFIGTDHQKPYLEEAPYLIIVFKQQYHTDANGTRYAHYYYEISTAVACGILVTAIHNAGLCTVVTTPLNAGGQLRELLGRPANEKVMLLLPVGYPAEGAKVPDIGRKSLDEIMVIV